MVKWLKYISFLRLTVFNTKKTKQQHDKKKLDKKTRQFKILGYFWFFVWFTLKLYLSIIIKKVMTEFTTEFTV